MRLLYCVLLLTTLLPPWTRADAAPLSAQQPQDDDDDDAGENKQALLPPDPSGKLYERFVVTRGFYIAADVGLMRAIGGAENRVSNTQAYVGLNIGYDINFWLSWQVHGGRGFNANSPLTAKQSQRIRDFAWTNILTGPVAWIAVWERLAIEIKLQGGVALLDPVPIEQGVDGFSVNMVNPTVGGGIGLKYFTLLANCTLGLEATFMYIIGVNVPAVNVSPLVVRYTF